MDQVSSLLIVKINSAQSNGDKPRNWTERMDATPARKRTMNWKKRNKLRVATWNIKSLNKRDQEIEKELRDHRIDICALQETKKKGNGQMMIGEYILIYNGVAKNERAKEGVGLMIKKQYRNQIEECRYKSQRIIMIKLRSNKKKINLVGIYAPENCKPEADREKFYEELQDMIDEIPSSESIIILGDFNARIGDTVIAGIKQRFNEQVKNENGDLMIDFCFTNELRINNTYFDHKEQYKYTFENTRGNRSMIDYVLTNREIHPQRILDVRSLTSANVGSDHYLVLCKVRMKISTHKNHNDKNMEIKLRIESLKDETTKDLYRRRLEQKIISNPIMEEDSIEKSWEKIKTNMLEAAYEAVGTKNIDREGRWKTKTPWFNPDVKQKCREKKSAYLRYLSSKNTETYQEYKTIRAETHELVRRTKKEYWETFSNRLEADFYGQQKQIWRVIRQQRKETNELIEYSQIEDKKWVEHITEMFKKTENRIIMPETPDITTNETTKITEEEVKEALKKLKNRKSPGEDQIANELHKNGGSILIKQMKILIQKIIGWNRIPDEWRRAIMIVMFKKGDRKDPNNYRGINLLNTTLKLTTRIITTKINQRIQLEEEQQGFRTGRSCTDAIFIIRQLKEKSLEYNIPAYLCLIDLKKAFDRIQIEDVIHLLYDRNIPLDLIKTIENIYKGNKVIARINGRLTEPIDYETGIRQGDSLSPLLFNIVMDEIIKKVKTLKGYKMGNKELKIVCYADDVILMAENEDDLQRLLYRFNATAVQFNMMISTEKTKSLVIAKEPLRCKLVVQEKIIEQVMGVEYLGITISSDGKVEEEVRTQVNKANRIAGCLNNTIFKNKFLSTEVKSSVYKSVVRPIMTYVAETRSDTKITQRILETTEMKILRKIANKSLREKTRSEEIRRVCKVDNINQWIKNRKIEWNDHITRMSENREVRIARDKSPNGRRSIGRPRKRWSDNLED